MKPGRNDPCPCGSGKKYKHCCQAKESGGTRQANAGQLMQAAVAHHNAGQLAQAEAVYRQVLQIEPNHPDANHNLGLIAMQTKRHAAGLPYLENAWKIAPSNEQFCLALIDCLLTLDRPDDALRIINNAVPHQFNSPQAQHLRQLAKNMASGELPPPSIEQEVMTLFNAGQHAALERRLTPLMVRYPNWGDGWQLLGIALASQDKDAETALRRAVELSPDDAQAHHNLGTFLYRQAAFDAAQASCRHALAIKPDFAEAHCILGIVMKALGQLDDAVASCRQALAIKPDFAEAHNNLGISLQALGQHDAAVPHFRRALEIKPDYAEAHSNLGIALQTLGQLDDAVASLRRALQVKPDYADAHNNLGNALKDIGQLDDAMASYRRALEIRPDFAKAYSNLLLTMQYAECYTPAESFTEHLAYAQRFEAPLKKNWLPHPNPRDPAKRLKIGYVSPDFHAHAVAYFIEPVLAHHDRWQVEIYCYYNHAFSDDVTLRLKSLAGHWRDISALGDDEVAQQIRGDGIDILVDLAGHTAGGRMLTFARKPAPVQATWLGYLCTTGLAAMDYRISDAHADPIGMSEPYYSETLYRLPDSFVCYSPPHDAPGVGNLPAIARGGITFGSFNTLAKLTPGVRALWAQVLRAVPGSRLMLKTKGLNDAQLCQQLVEDFAKHGVGEERLILASWDATHFDHLNRYNQVDIGLDPFPCNGGTTSFDTMWMGVPVVTLAGDRFISRMGVSMLTSLGLTELVADTPEDYVAIAARLAGDPERLAALRAGLRERMANSPLTDAKRFTHNLEKAYREMWGNWCGRSQNEAR